MRADVRPYTALSATARAVNSATRRSSSRRRAGARCSTPLSP
ncbi:hypothetical protein [Streptomyces sp. NPDC096142]